MRLIAVAQAPLRDSGAKVAGSAAAAAARTVTQWSRVSVRHSTGMKSKESTEMALRASLKGEGYATRRLHVVLNKICAEDHSTRNTPGRR